MALSLSSAFTVKALCTLTNTLDLSTATDVLNLSEKITLTSGTGSDQADRIFHDTRTLAASATEDLDLAGGSLTGPLGTALTFTRVKGIIVIASTGNTNNVNVTRPAANSVPLFLASSDGIAVRPGGIFAAFAPDATAYAVTAATGDLLTFTNSSSGSSVTYDVVIVGTSA